MDLYRLAQVALFPRHFHAGAEITPSLQEPLRPIINRAQSPVCCVMSVDWLSVEISVKRDLFHPPSPGLSGSPL